MAAPQLNSDSKYDNYDYPTTSPTAQNGHPGHTTPEQDAQVYQLRTQLEQAGYSERLDTLSMVSLNLCTVQSPWLKSSSFVSCGQENSTSIWPNKCLSPHAVDNHGMLNDGLLGLLTARNGGRSSASTISYEISITKKNLKFSSTIPSIITK